MKVLHVVTLVTPDGAYGGPTRVAVNLCSALRHQGHDAVIAAGVNGFDEPPAALGGVPAHLFPARRVIPGFGYAPTHAPALGRWIDEHASKFDIVHIHLARDLVTLPAAARLRRMRIPFVVQTHGMIVPRSHPLAPPIDRLWTVRLLRSAAMVLHLNPAERRDLCTVGGSGLRLRQLPNGVPTPAATASGQRSAALPEVLFFARLHERKRPEVFAEAALSLLRSGSVRNSPSSGLRREPTWGLMRSLRRRVRKGSARSSFGGSPRWRRISPVSEWPAHPFMCCPLCGSRSRMTVLEALMLGIPVIICADNGLADFVRTHACGLVVEGSPQSFAQAISDLLSDPSCARGMGQRGRSAVQSAFSIVSVGRELEQIYSQILEQGSE